MKQGVKAFVVGKDFTFGSGAKGNVDLLERLSKEMDFGVVVVHDTLHNERRVSSSWIRESLVKGDIGLANTLLGKKYSIREKCTRTNSSVRKSVFPQQT